MSLHILALVTEAFGGKGGIAQYNRDFLQALSQADDENRITVLPRYAEKGILPERNILQLSARRSRLGFAISAFINAMIKRPEFIFCGHLYIAPLASLLAMLTGAKLIIQMHGIEAWHTPSKLQRAAVETADLILCVSRYTRGEVLKWAAIAPERVVVLPNTVSEKFRPGASDLRERLGLADRRILLTVGRLDHREKYKGHDRVIRAMPEIISNGYDVVYIIVGDGDDAARLQALATELGVKDRVPFRPGVSEKELLEYYRMADLYLMPSTGEGFGITYLEAMASGTGSLGLSIAGTRDALADGELGLCVREEGLVQAICDGLERSRVDPGQLSASVRARFGRSAFDRQMQGLFKRVKAAA